jgi:hypothetical protein
MATHYVAGDRTILGHISKRGNRFTHAVHAGRQGDPAQTGK